MTYVLYLVDLFLLYLYCILLLKYFQAGIDNNQLKLVLEPEAASLYCQVNYTRRDVQAGAIAELKHFPVGHKYIVADLGG